ncbi:uncharacterized protein LOC106462090 [Limulus polyphemus]|uniref:Uncharacterized protein LOC106462090 n=1 Tax=Limulus polyphemus TaxID=6850 RepID=A0ABM1SMT2_LIMPO|nr:uncharacterized protein LOC106462090 [Limulus polyphemus]XP_022244938.1 uncharacterized protein LOC106462090 [Limulus polyphemus]
MVGRQSRYRRGRGGRRIRGRGRGGSQRGRYAFRNRIFTRKAKSPSPSEDVFIILSDIENMDDGSEQEDTKLSFIYTDKHSDEDEPYVLASKGENKKSTHTKEGKIISTKPSDSSSQSVLSAADTEHMSVKAVMTKRSGETANTTMDINTSELQPTSSKSSLQSAMLAGESKLEEKDESCSKIMKEKNSGEVLQMSNDKNTDDTKNKNIINTPDKDINASGLEQNLDDLCKLEYIDSDEEFVELEDMSLVELIGEKWQVLDFDNSIEDISEKMELWPKQEPVKKEMYEKTKLGGLFCGFSHVEHNLRRNKAALVGLEYIVEVWKIRWRKFCYFECVLCNRLLNQKTMIEHVTSRAHRISYLVKHLPNYGERFPVAKTKNWKQKFVKALNGLCLQLEKCFGRQKMHITTLRYFQKHKNDIRMVIEEGPHYSENEKILLPDDVLLYKRSCLTTTSALSSSLHESKSAESTRHKKEREDLDDMKTSPDSKPTSSTEEWKNMSNSNIQEMNKKTESTTNYIGIKEEEELETKSNSGLRGLKEKIISSSLGSSGDSESLKTAEANEGEKIGTKMIKSDAENSIKTRNIQRLPEVEVKEEKIQLGITENKKMDDVASQIQECAKKMPTVSKVDKPSEKGTLKDKRKELSTSDKSQEKEEKYKTSAESGKSNRNDKMQTITKDSSGDTNRQVTQKVSSGDRYQSKQDNKNDSPGDYKWPSEKNKVISQIDKEQSKGVSLSDKDQQKEKTNTASQNDIQSLKEKNKSVIQSDKNQQGKKRGSNSQSDKEPENKKMKNETQYNRNQKVDKSTGALYVGKNQKYISSQSNQDQHKEEKRNLLSKKEMHKETQNRDGCMTKRDEEREKIRTNYFKKDKDGDSGTTSRSGLAQPNEQKKSTSLAIRNDRIKIEKNRDDQKYVGKHFEEDGRKKNIKPRQMTRNENYKNKQHVPMKREHSHDYFVIKRKRSRSPTKPGERSTGFSRDRQQSTSKNSSYWISSDDFKSKRSRSRTPSVNKNHRTGSKWNTNIKELETSAVPEMKSSSPKFPVGEQFWGDSTFSYYQDIFNHPKNEINSDRFGGSKQIYTDNKCLESDKGDWRILPGREDLQIEQSGKHSEEWRDGYGVRLVQAEEFSSSSLMKESLEKDNPAMMTTEVRKEKWIEFMKKRKEHGLFPYSTSGFPLQIDNMVKSSQSGVQASSKMPSNEGDNTGFMSGVNYIYNKTNTVAPQNTLMWQLPYQNQQDCGRNRPSEIGETAVPEKLRSYELLPNRNNFGHSSNLGTFNTNLSQNNTCISLGSTLQKQSSFPLTALDYHLPQKLLDTSQQKNVSTEASVKDFSEEYRESIAEEVASVLTKLGVSDISEARLASVLQHLGYVHCNNSGSSEIVHREDRLSEDQTSVYNTMSGWEGNTSQNAYGTSHINKVTEVTSNLSIPLSYGKPAMSDEKYKTYVNLGSGLFSEASKIPTGATKFPLPNITVPSYRTIKPSSSEIPKYTSKEQLVCVQSNYQMGQSKQRKDKNSCGKDIQTTYGWNFQNTPSGMSISSQNLPSTQITSSPWITPALHSQSISSNITTQNIQVSQNTNPVPVNTSNSTTSTSVQQITPIFPPPFEIIKNFPPPLPSNVLFSGNIGVKPFFLP